MLLFLTNPSDTRIPVQPQSMVATVGIPLKEIWMSKDVGSSAEGKSVVGGRVVVVAVRGERASPAAALPPSFLSF